MRAVEGPGGTYLLVKRAGESSLVRDPETGEERYVPNDDLEPAGEDPLTLAAAGVTDGARALLRGCHDDATLGLLLELDRRGPLPVRELLSLGETCESDLNGLLAELRAAGCVEETEVGGERGYRVSEGVSAALSALRAD
jgi:hypothetical protein